jgi:hypothetical protein
MVTPHRPSPSQPLRRFTGSWSPAIGRMLGSSQYGVRAGLLNDAEIVVWQSSRRVLFATGVGLVALVLRLVGVLTGPVWPILVIIPTYIAFIAVIAVAIGRRRQVAKLTLILLSLADVAAIFITVAFVTSPAFYPRALLLSLLALQFTQLFFARTPAMTTVIASGMGYAALLFTAWNQGVGIGWAEQGWMLAIYFLVAFHGMALHASAHRRLAALVDLFASAQRGDFSRTFVEEKGREPDGISVTRTIICAPSSRRWCTPIRSPDVSIGAVSSKCCDTR